MYVYSSNHPKVLLECRLSNIWCVGRLHRPPLTTPPPLNIELHHFFRCTYEDVSPGEAAQLAVHCDIGQHDLMGGGGSDIPIPIILLRNVTYFCISGGLKGMADAFRMPPSQLPLPIAHALISVLCNIKPWLNYRSCP